MVLIGRCLAPGLDRGQRDQVVGVVDGAAARQVVGRAGEPLQHRTDDDRAAEALGQLVTDVAGIEIGKNQHVGAAVDARIGNFLRRDGGHDGGVELHFAFDLDAGQSPRASRVASRTLSTSG